MPIQALITKFTTKEVVEAMMGWLGGWAQLLNHLLMSNQTLSVMAVLRDD